MTTSKKERVWNDPPGINEPDSAVNKPLTKPEFDDIIKKLGVFDDIMRKLGVGAIKSKLKRSLRSDSVTILSMGLIYYYAPQLFGLSQETLFNATLFTAAVTMALSLLIRD